MDDLIKNRRIFHYRYWEAISGGDFQVRGIGGEEFMPPGMVFRRHGTPDWMLMLYTPGCVVTFQGRPVVIKEDTLGIFPPGTEHCYGNDEAVWSHSWMHVCGGEMDLLMQKYPRLINTPLPYGHRAFLRHLDYMAGEFRCRRRDSWQVCRNTVTHLLMEVADYSRNDKNIPERMLKLRGFMEKNYLKPLTLEKLAHYISVSVPLLSMEFKKSFGISPIACLQEIRLRHSLYYLSDLNLSIEDVANRCGFRDPFYFSRLFRRKYGQPPSIYRSSINHGALNFYQSCGFHVEGTLKDHFF
ncbi:MAG: helix-turn-helix domain-containing protein [Lentisphaerae bacterium]|nr:helix-turn-helix domain-containing protein [Lentisphaerota bacterium]